MCTQDIDLRCEQLIKEEFGVECNFDVVDAVRKLEKLGIVSRVSSLSIHENSNASNRTEKEKGTIACLLDYFMSSIKADLCKSKGIRHVWTTVVCVVFKR